MFIPSCEKVFCDVGTEFEILYSFLCVIEKNMHQLQGPGRDFNPDVDIVQSVLPDGLLCIATQ